MHALSVGTFALFTSGYAQASVDQLPTEPGPFTVQAIGKEAFTYDSNPLLLTSGAKSLWGSTTTPELIFSGNSPATQMTSDTKVAENLYNESDFDSTDLHEKADLLTRMQQWSAATEGKVDYDTTRQSELTTFNINQATVRHTGLSLAPSVSYLSTPVDKFTLGGSAAMSHYNNTAYTDYDVFEATPSYVHNFNALNAGIMQVDAQHYQTARGPSLTVDSVGPSLGWIATLTPRLNAKVTGGIEYVSQRGAGIGNNGKSLNTIFSADLGFRGEVDTIDFISSRSQYPFGNGTEALLSTVSATENHELTKRISLNIAGSYQSAQYASSPGGVNLNSLINVNPGVTYHLLNDLDVNANYQYKYETLTNTPNAVTDHSVMLALIYRPKADAITW